MDGRFAPVCVMQDSSTQRLVLILQADPTHQAVIQAVLADHDPCPAMIAIAHPQDAIAYLRRQAPYTEAQRPDLILLDLELGGERTGYELLQTLKGDRDLRRIPVIVLTLSDRADDIFNTYAVQGNCYVVRPHDRDRLTQTIRRIEDFWLKIVTLPLE